MNNLTLELLKDVSKINREDLSRLQDAFLFCRTINDIETSVTSLEALLESSERCYIFKEQSIVKGFILITYKESLEALGFSTFITKDCSPRLFYKLIQISSILLIYKMYKVNINRVYFDVANIKVKKIVEKILQAHINSYFIYEDYIVCYSEFSKDKLIQILNTSQSKQILEKIKN